VSYNYVRVRTSDEERKGTGGTEVNRTIRGGGGWGIVEIRRPQDTSEGTANFVFDIRHGHNLIQAYSIPASSIPANKIYTLQKNFHSHVQCSLTS